MRERGDLAVLHEPFMYHHYLAGGARVFPGFEPEPGHPVSYADIRAMILAAAADGPVFFKDMAYYVGDELPGDAGFAAQMSHAFLVRDPVAAAVSYVKRDPGFACYELGHEAQYRLYQALVGLGHAPLVMTADQLRADPEGVFRRYWAHCGLDFAAHAFAWDRTVPEGWRSVAAWHGDVLASGAIRAAASNDAAGKLAALGAPYVDYADYHLPYYEKMRRIAEVRAELG